MCIIFGISNSMYPVFFGYHLQHATLLSASLPEQPLERFYVTVDDVKIFGRRLGVFVLDCPGMPHPDLIKERIAKHYKYK